jgi:hypothetical protein
VEKTEFISDLSIQGSTDFEVIAALRINPANDLCFPWLSIFANAYESYCFHRLTFEYKPQCATSRDGYTAIAVDYDPDDSLPTSKVEAFEYEETVRGAPWAAFNHVSTKKNLAKRKTYFVRNPGIAEVHMTAATDSSLYDVGNLLVMGGTSDETGFLAGELWVHYAVEFMTPQMESAEGPGSLISATSTDDASITADKPLGNSWVYSLDSSKHWEVFNSDDEGVGAIRFTLTKGVWRPYIEVFVQVGNPEAPQGAGYLLSDYSDDTSVSTFLTEFRMGSGTTAFKTDWHYADSGSRNGSDEGPSLIAEFFNFSTLFYPDIWGPMVAGDWIEWRFPSSTFTPAFGSVVETNIVIWNRPIYPGDTLLEFTRGAIRTLKGGSVNPISPDIFRHIRSRRTVKAKGQKPPFASRANTVSLDTLSSPQSPSAKKTILPRNTQPVGQVISTFDEVSTSSQLQAENYREDEGLQKQDDISSCGQSSDHAVQPKPLGVEGHGSDHRQTPEVSSGYSGGRMRDNERSCQGQQVSFRITGLPNPASRRN